MTNGLGDLVIYTYSLLKYYHWSDEVPFGRNPADL
jgi:hypothetical protein